MYILYVWDMIWAPGPMWAHGPGEAPPAPMNGPPPAPPRAHGPTWAQGPISYPIHIIYTYIYIYIY